MGGFHDYRKNGSGCWDPTAYKAMTNIEKNRKTKKKVGILLKNIFKLCDKAGYRVEGRIVLVDKKTGEIHK